MDGEVVPESANPNEYPEDMWVLTLPDSTSFPVNTLLNSVKFIHRYDLKRAYRAQNNALGRRCGGRFCLGTCCGKNGCCRKGWTCRYMPNLRDFYCIPWFLRLFLHQKCHIQTLPLLQIIQIKLYIVMKDNIIAVDLSISAELTSTKDHLIFFS